MSDPATFCEIGRGGNRPLAQAVFSRMNDLGTIDVTPDAAADATAGAAPERRRVPRRPPIHAHAWLIAAATLGVALTAVLSATPLMPSGSRNVALHVAVELTAALASTVAAQLVYGRFRSTLQLHDLLLFAALCGFAATNLLFST